MMGLPARAQTPPAPPIPPQSPPPAASQRPSAAPALPAPGPEALRRARASYTRAVALMQRGDWERAAPLMELVHQSIGLKNALWNLAECYRQLGRPGAALAALEKYLAHPRTTAAERAQARRDLQALRARTAQLKVVANLEGANVTVDGRAVGQTPLRLSLDPGGHAIEVGSAGFRTERSQLVLVPGAERDLRVVLTTLPGSLEITSRPAGAEIRFGDKVLGKTPLRTSIPGGIVEVAARLAGHRTVRRQVTVAPGEAVRLDLVLPPLSALVSVSANRPKAKVTLGGKGLGEAPVASVSVSPGERDIAVSTTTESWRGKLSLRDGDRAQVSVTLHRGRLAVGYFATAAALAGASLVGGVVLLSEQRNSAGEFEATRTSLRSLFGTPTQLQQLRAVGVQQADSANLYGRAAMGLFIAAGAMAAVSAVLAIFTQFRASDAAVQVAPSADSGGGSP
jgi:hypothetical protein